MERKKYGEIPDYDQDMFDHLLGNLTKAGGEATFMVLTDLFAQTYGYRVYECQDNESAAERSKTIEVILLVLIQMLRAKFRNPGYDAACVQVAQEFAIFMDAMMIAEEAL